MISVLAGGKKTNESSELRNEVSSGPCIILDCDSESTTLSIVTLSNPDAHSLALTHNAS